MLVLRYINSHHLLGWAAVYFIVMGLLKILTGINLLPPCLSVLILGMECWGCGMTTGILNIIKLDFAAAYAANPMSLIVFPAGMYFIVRDFLAFLKESKTSV